MLLFRAVLQILKPDNVDDANANVTSILFLAMLDTNDHIDCIYLITTGKPSGPAPLMTGLCVC